MGELTAGNIAEVMFDNMVETFEEQTLMLNLVDADPSDGERLQNAGNTIHYPVQQHRPILKGFDMTGKATGIIEETYPISLSDPSNDFISQRIDSMRDQRFWERAGVQSGMQQATDLNSAVADLVADTGSLYVRSNVSSGFDFISLADTLLVERQVYRTMGANFLLNPRDSNSFATDLAGRETLKGRPADTWLNGQIGSNVSEMDVFRGSFLEPLAGAANVGTTTTADVSEKPEGGTVDPVTKEVLNVDYRRGSFPVTSSADFTVGDFISAGTVQSIGLASKNASGTVMTFKIVAIPDATTIEVFPKPIALDDPALSTLEKAYANINTQILSGAAITRLNITTTKTNLFWCKDSIQLIGAEAPWAMMSENGGKKVLSKALTSGVTIYMIYDSDITTAEFTYRCFVWYGLANRNPMANGTAVSV